MYLLYILFLVPNRCELTSLRAYELTSLRSVKRTWKGSRKVYMYPRTTFNHSSPLLSISISHQPSLTMTSATKVASWLSKEHHRSSQSNETSFVGATFACSLRAAKVKLGPEQFAKYKVVIFENNTAKSAVVDVHDTVYSPTTLSKFEIYFEEKDRRCGTHRHHDFVRRWFLPAGSRISRRRRHADRCQHVRVVQVPLQSQRQSSDEEIRSHVYAHRTFNAHGSQTRLPIRLGVDHAVLHDAVPTAIKEKCDT
jgi:hypothetical protein